METVKIKEAIVNIAKQGKTASRSLGALSTSDKNTILLQIAQQLIEQQDHIFSENAKDLVTAREKGISGAMLNRLEITTKVLESMVTGLREVAALEDPVGEVEEMGKRPSGITVGRMRVPLGVICMIFESRPNVTIDAAALCLKAGNAVILRGGSEALNSNLALAGIMQDVLSSNSVDPSAVQVLPFTDREGVDVLLEQEEYIDLVIPRGGEGLIRAVSEKSRIPVLKHYKGVCHIYVDDSADVAMGQAIVFNSKVQRPGVCNALEGVLVHRDIAHTFLPAMWSSLKAAGVKLLGCNQSCSILPDIEKAEEQDWGTEFLALVMVVKVVESMEEAMDYIAAHGSNHTETIVTGSYPNSQRFLREVDASAVMVNASTRFNDGGQFGLGAEIGISTTKLHAYGPMGLKELTTRKFIVYGTGETRA